MASGMRGCRWGSEEVGLKALCQSSWAVVSFGCLFTSAKDTTECTEKKSMFRDIYRAWEQSGGSWRQKSGDVWTEARMIVRQTSCNNTRVPHSYPANYVLSQLSLKANVRGVKLSCDLMRCAMPC
jgi:hypothetical protein